MNIVYLLDVQSDNAKGWFLTTSRNKERLYNELKSASGGSDDLSDVLLDISEVIIDTGIEHFLYQQIRNNNLNVIDNTKVVETTLVKDLPKPLTEMEEGVDYRKLIHPNGEVDRERVELIVGTLEFRNEAFQQVKFNEQQKKLAVPVIDYFEKKLEGNQVVPYKFTRESAMNLLQDVIKFREKSDLRFLISLAGISDLDVESTKELAAFLISQNKIVEVSKYTTRTTFALRKLLPTIAQLCSDFSSSSVIWEDMRRRYPVGSYLYISPSESKIGKYQVVRNNYINAKGENILHKDLSELTEIERYDYMNMSLKRVSDLSEETDEEKAEREANEKARKEAEAKGKGSDKPEEIAVELLTEDFDLQRNQFIGRFVLVIPCAILEGTDYPYGMPDIQGGELTKHLAYNIIEKHREVKLSPNHDIFQVNEQTNASTNWIRMYRKNMAKFYAKFGLELPEIDLMKIMEGERSPLEKINLSKLMKSQNERRQLNE